MQSIYAAISGIQMLAMLGNILENYRLCLRAADKLHKGLLGSLLAAPMSFFHTTPVGRYAPHGRVSHRWQMLSCSGITWSCLLVTYTRSRLLVTHTAHHPREIICASDRILPHLLSQGS